MFPPIAAAAQYLPDRRDAANWLRRSPFLLQSGRGHQGDEDGEVIKPGKDWSWAVQ